MARPPYPFVPRSNAHLRPGQFWAVPLSDGRFACGRVLAVPGTDDPCILAASTRSFLAGLLEWVGDKPPIGPDIMGAGLVDDGMAHIRTILTTGGMVLGWRDLGQLAPSEKVSHRAGGTVHVYGGATRLRRATQEEAATMPVMSVWGFGVLQAVAEARWVGRPGTS